MSALTLKYGSIIILSVPPLIQKFLLLYSNFMKEFLGCGSLWQLFSQLRIHASNPAFCIYLENYFKVILKLTHTISGHYLEVYQNNIAGYSLFSSLYPTNLKPFSAFSGYSRSSSVGLMVTPSARF